jgi:proline dehydrogenase
MLRTTILYLSRARWARRAVTRLPVARDVAARFVAGETAADAIRTVRSLNARGINATLDHLGESVTNEADATRAADDYVYVLGQIHDCDVRSNVSIKLTQMGLDLSVDFCIDNVRRIVDTAQRLGNFVRIDMEGTPHTDRTIDVFNALRRNFDNVGLVLQAYLYRTEADMLALLQNNVRLRLCKGAYQEPPDKALARKTDVDDNFLRLMRLLLDNAYRTPPAGETGRFPPLPAIATHDEKMVAGTLAYAAKLGLPSDRYEFQMLHGIGRELQDRLAAHGQCVRVYVPYGTEWYPYFMRRLAERPANVWFLLSNLFRR